MAAFANRKRKMNVRSGSSCSSRGSTENCMETGYVSDNSNSDVETANRRQRNTGKNSFSDKEGNSFFSQGSILKKEFILNIDGRKKQDDSDEVECYQTPRKRGNFVSKNALMARANRIKKKLYLEDLEKKIEELTKENEELKEQVKKNDELVQKQSEEVRYLKGVLANSPEISMLLKCVRQGTTLPVTSSVNKFGVSHSFKEPPFDSDFPDDPLLSSCDFESLKTELPDSVFLEEDLSDKTLDIFEGSSTASVGICLHVAQQRVSLEFCPTCSTNANAAWQESTG